MVRLRVLHLINQNAWKAEAQRCTHLIFLIEQCVPEHEHFIEAEVPSLGCTTKRFHYTLISSRMRCKTNVFITERLVEIGRSDPQAEKAFEFFSKAACAPKCSRYVSSYDGLYGWPHHRWPAAKSLSNVAMARLGIGQ